MSSFQRVVCTGSKPEDVSLFSLQDEMTALMHAAYKGNIEACRKLLEHGADVNWHGHKDGVS